MENVMPKFKVAVEKTTVEICQIEVEADSQAAAELAMHNRIYEHSLKKREAARDAEKYGDGDWPEPIPVEVVELYSTDYRVVENDWEDD
jgi:ribosomal protein S12 methylthiotransferase accessory factor YcaO